MIDDKYSELTGQIIGLAMKVHRVLGRGFSEIIYQRALAVEFKKNNIEFIREKEMPIWYEEDIIGKRRVDFWVENKVLVELKAVGELSNGNFTQAMNYVKLYRMPIALLVNFGGDSLTFKRVHNNEILNEIRNNDKS
ncbi:MAG: GxxExxY protein [Spirosomataceae bacterium]|jgi:GxxExxY protein